MKTALVLVMSLSVYAGSQIPMTKGVTYELRQGVRTIAKNLTAFECGVRVKRTPAGQCVRVHKDTK